MNKQSTVLVTDFKSDFRQIIANILTANGVAVDSSEPYDRAVYRFYANARRRITPQAYKIKEASTLQVPPALAAGYAQLKQELIAGADVTARLSRKIVKATYEDAMLNDFGVTHFHLSLRQQDGAVPGTDPVLFALVRADTVYCIGLFSHGEWSKQEVLEIVERDWPEAIEPARAKIALRLDHALTDDERAQLRSAHVTTMSEINGKVYMPPGLGVTSAGTSLEAEMKMMRAIKFIALLEEQVHANADHYLSELARSGRKPGSSPTFHLGFHTDGQVLITEPTAGVSLLLGPSPLDA